MLVQCNLAYRGLSYRGILQFFDAAIFRPIQTHLSYRGILYIRKSGTRNWLQISVFDRLKGVKNIHYIKNSDPDAN